MNRAAAIVAVALSSGLLAGCGAAANPMGPTAGATGASTLTLSGSWGGRVSDSSGTMMGAGLNAAMMADTVWQITQTGSTFAGTGRFGGYMGGPMTITGTINGRTGSFTMTMPAGFMMSGTCLAVATGTFDLDDMFAAMHGAYAGSNSCRGAFDHGQIQMGRR